MKDRLIPSLEKLEDPFDLKAACRAVAGARGKKLNPWNKIKARFGL